jgi:hypothetical protein
MLSFVLGENLGAYPIDADLLRDDFGRLAIIARDAARSFCILEG